MANSAGVNHLVQARVFPGEEACASFVSAAPGLLVWSSTGLTGSLAGMVALLIISSLHIPQSFQLVGAEVESSRSCRQGRPWAWNFTEHLRSSLPALRLPQLSFQGLHQRHSFLFGKEGVI